MSTVRRGPNARNQLASVRESVPRPRRRILYSSTETTASDVCRLQDVELLSKLINRHGRIVGRRKTGCSSISQHAVTRAIKRARFMALLPYVAE